MNLPIPVGAKYINLSSESALLASNTNLQRNCNSRIKLDNKILTITVNKNDVDSVSKSTDRRRNEISSKMIQLNNGEKGIWGGEFKIDGHVNTVDTWYHIVQIKYNNNLRTFKNLDRSVPPFTFSLFDKYLCVRPNLNRGYIPVELIKNIVNKWISFRIEVDNSKNGSIKWYVNSFDEQGFEQNDSNIDDITLQLKDDIKNNKITKLYKCGTYNCKDLGTVDLDSGGIYFKCGQYMSADYIINDNQSTSYRNLWAKK